MNGIKIKIFVSINKDSFMELYVFYFDESFHDRKILISDKGTYNDFVKMLLKITYATECHVSEAPLF